MPLIKGKSKKAFEGNIKAEMNAGKPQDQALAIAYSMKKKAKKMAEGGQIKDNEQSSAHEEQMLHAKENEAPPHGYMEPEMGPKRDRAMAAFHGKPMLRGSGNKDYQSEMPDQGHTVTLHLNPQSQYDPKEEPAAKHNGSAMSEDDRDLNQHGEDETGPMGAYADGGNVGRSSARTYDEQRSQKGVHVPRGIGGPSKEKYGESHMGYASRGAKAGGTPAYTGAFSKREAVPSSAFNEQAKKEARRVISENKEINPKLEGLADGGELSAAEKMQQMKAGAQNVLGKDNPPATDLSSAWHNIKDAFTSPDQTKSAQSKAEGGFITDNKQDDSHEMDMVERIMKKRQMCYSEGGKVANEDQGESASEPDDMAKNDQNEFDDLALRDDLESSYDGANSGDEDGSKLNQVMDEDDDHYDDDFVGKIMKKRSSKK